jgi:hypothetical protein
MVSSGFGCCGSSDAGVVESAVLRKKHVGNYRCALRLLDFIIGSVQGCCGSRNILE